MLGINNTEIGLVTNIPSILIVIENGKIVS